ncbi:MAG: hypothetical protein ACYTEZ_18395 [Planctomycetota bacterium]
MRSFARFLVVAVLFGAAGVGLFHLASPANETNVDGPADPILRARREVLGLLRRWGLIKKPLFPGYDPWLPSCFVSEWLEDGPDGGRVVSARLSRTTEPVYRGLFWVVGDRVTVRMEEFLEPDREVRRLRLGYVANGRRYIAGERRFEACARDYLVSGFVPRTSEGYYAEEIGPQGEARILCSRGTDALDRVLGLDR